MAYRTITVLVILFLFLPLHAEPDWTEGVLIPRGGRSNPYGFVGEDWVRYNTQGRLHAQIYPVEVTGSLPPQRPLAEMFAPTQEKLNPVQEWIGRFIRGVTQIKDFDQVLSWLGLHRYPASTDEGVYSVPFPQGVRPDHRMGFSIMERHGVDGFTFSCAVCHSSNLFGKTVLGMTNRFPRANELFIKAKKAFDVTPALFFQQMTGANENEVTLYRETKNNLKYVALTKPVTLGLDTSLSQVARSLNLRAPTPWAEQEPEYRFSPREDDLDYRPADSKPAVWWNLKYKNRWLSDGSVVSGNPIYTNILWNEIGRGVDLRVLADWLNNNSKVIAEITTAVFASQAPLFTDFFPAEMIDLERAKAGEKIYVQTCAKCHGTYKKNWDILPESAPHLEKLKTAEVIYHSRTPVIDVGTDPLRYLGMKSLEKLNDLQISKDNNILIRAQKGYVPPPLVGIWARWPYFHNNSVPSLCALLTAAPDRPKIYWARPAENPTEDFDPFCNGYPQNLAETKKIPELKYNTRRRGMSNMGHDQGIFIKDGKEILTAADKKNLIQFLQTL